MRVKNSVLHNFPFDKNIPFKFLKPVRKWGNQEMHRGSRVCRRCSGHAKTSVTVIVISISQKRIIGEDKCVRRMHFLLVFELLLNWNPKFSKRLKETVAASNSFQIALAKRWITMHNQNPFEVKKRRTFHWFPNVLRYALEDKGKALLIELYSMTMPHRI